jgi:hypothetical protein
MVQQTVYDANASENGTMGYGKTHNLNAQGCAGCYHSCYCAGYLDARVGVKANSYSCCLDDPPLYFINILILNDNSSQKGTLTNSRQDEPMHF